MICEQYAMACAYVDTCCFTHSESSFGGILSENVTLEHRTMSVESREEIRTAEGRGAVSALFKRYIFDNSSNFLIEKFSLEPCQIGVALDLTGEEDKLEDGKKNRYRFVEKTILGFLNEKEYTKISLIKMEVFRTPIQA